MKQRGPKWRRDRPNPNAGANVSAAARDAQPRRIPMTRLVRGRVWKPLYDDDAIERALRDDRP